MSVQEHHIEVSRTSRYYTLGNKAAAKEIWIVLHGYGQLAKYFIKHFEPVKQGRLIAAPEGLSRFYLSNNEGRVGASWMTKEDRISEIEDQHRQLDKIAFQVSTGAELPIHVLGFSQGTATAVRWLLNSELPIQRSVLWGGDIPRDVDHSRLSARSATNPIEMVLGTEDQYISEERIQEFEKNMVEKGLHYSISRYLGGHTIESSQLALLLP